MGSLIIALAGVTALVVLAAWASRKGWIYLGFKRPTGTTSGGLGQIAEAFQPSYSYYAEEKERYHSAVEASGPGLAEDHELLWTLRPATTPNDKSRSRAGTAERQDRCGHDK